MCQEFPKEKWVDARREDVLDAPYFHVVFTVPEELNPVIYSNQKLLYDALYHASSDTLRELASKNHWKDNGEEFFLPIRVISRLFRGKYLAELKHLWEDGKQLEITLKREGK